MGFSDIDATESFKKDVLANFIRDLVRNNDYISEIETNGPGTLFYKERGKRRSVDMPITTEEDYLIGIKGIIEDAGLIERNYLVEGRYRLPNNRTGRLHITMSPASEVPLLTLAIKTTTLTDLTAVEATGSFNTEISKFLRAAIGSKLTIVLSGGTGAGKTTLLEALTSEFNEDERIGVCEDSPELQLKNRNTAYLNSTAWVPGMSEKDVAPLDWIVKQINRMRVDRVIVGETRGKEFFDFVTAANSGAEGSLTTLHANDGHSAMKKMSTFMYMAVDIAPRIINEMISQAVDIVIQLGHSKVDGSHKILSIHEVTQAISAGESPTITLNPLFVYEHDTNTWTRRFATDKLKERLERHGYDANTYTIKEEDEEETFQSMAGLPSYFARGDY